MKISKRTWIAIGVAAALGGTVLAGAGYASSRHGGGYHGHGMHGFGKAFIASFATDMFDSVDADGDGKLSQAEIDQAREALHAAHDADGDGSLGLEEFAGLWQETTRPLTVRAFQMLDTDGDAVVTREEYDRPLARIVERFDRNGDGALSMSDRWRGRHGGGRHGGS